MSDGSLVTESAAEAGVKQRRASRLWRVVALCAGCLLLLMASALVFRNALLNHFARPRIRAAFAKAHPGNEVRIGKLEYFLRANRLQANSITITGPKAAVSAGPIAVSGVHWRGALWGKSGWSKLLENASLSVSDATFRSQQYALRCDRIEASAPRSELLVQGAELRPLLDEEAFFATKPVRLTRIELTVPTALVTGLHYSELLQGKGYRAGAVQVSGLRFDAYVDREKPLKPLLKQPPMLHEALAAIPKPLRIDSLVITNGTIIYRERRAADTPPGVLTFSDVGLVGENFANRGPAGAMLRLNARGDLMGAGTLKVLVAMPVNPPDFSLRYSGSLSAMDLTRLNPFLENSQRIQVRSGKAQEVHFDIAVTDGHARGYVRGIYRDLQLGLLDKVTGEDDGVREKVGSFLMNVVKIRTGNAPEALLPMKEGRVEYTRRMGDKFQQFLWYALRTGVLDIIEH